MRNQLIPNCHHITCTFLLPGLPQFLMRYNCLYVPHCLSSNGSPHPTQPQLRPSRLTPRGTSMCCSAPHSGSGQLRFVRFVATRDRPSPCTIKSHETMKGTHTRHPLGEEGEGEGQGGIPSLTDLEPSTARDAATLPPAPNAAAPLPMSPSRGLAATAETAPEPISPCTPTARGRGGEGGALSEELLRPETA